MKSTKLFHCNNGVFGEKKPWNIGDTTISGGVCMTCYRKYKIKYSKSPSVEDKRVQISNLQPTRKIPAVRCYSSKINSQVSGSSKKIVDLSRNTPVIRFSPTSKDQASESIGMKKILNQYNMFFIRIK